MDILKGLKMLSIKYKKNEIEILIFISHFGRTYPEVLGKTFYKSIQTARNKISKMKKNGLLEYELSGLSKPKYSIVLTKESKS